MGYEENRAVVGHYGDQVALDVEAGVDMLIAKGWVDPRRVGVLGISHGSDEVIFAISHSHRYKAALINDGPVSAFEVQLPAVAQEQTQPLGSPLSWRPEAMRALMGFDPVGKPWADVFLIRTPLLLRWSGLQHDGAHLMDKELAMPYGDNAVFDAMDWRQQTYRLIYALNRNNVPIEVTIDRDGHGVSTPKYRVEFQSRILQWFDYFLLGKGRESDSSNASSVRLYRRVARKKHPSTTGSAALAVSAKQMGSGYERYHILSGPLARALRPNRHQRLEPEAHSGRVRNPQSGITGHAGMAGGSLEQRESRTRHHRRPLNNSPFDSGEAKSLIDL